MKIRRVSLREMPVIWPLVSEKMAEQPDWKPQPITDNVWSGAWDLWVATVDGEVVASAVTGWIDGWVWIFHATSTDLSGDFMPTFADVVETVFKNVEGYEGLKFTTTRRGFERVAPGMGFEPEPYRMYTRRI